MNLTKDIINRNLSELIDASGLSDHDFALLCGLSRGTIANIRNGKSPTAITMSTLLEIIKVTNTSLNGISKQNFSVPSKLRERLLRKYQKQPDLFVILSKTPAIPYIIKHKIIPSGFLDIARERHEIILFIKQKYSWDINSNTLSVALKRMKSSIQITKNPLKASGYLYKKLDVLSK